MRNWRANRFVFLTVCLFVCGGLITLSAAGTLLPAETLAGTPLYLISGVFNDISLTVNTAVTELSEIQILRERNAELEEALAQFQAELVQLREINSDYQRLTDLLEYTTSVQNQEFITADVINYDQSSLLRTIVINRGTRDGIARGMPVVTNLGLVGRVQEVTANASRVLLITDPSSYVSARLQTSRAEGSVEGQLTGNLRMINIALDANIQEGDLVLTSGLGGNFPPDIVIGQVQSKRQFEFELSQQAEVSSLVSFDTLEFVLVITNFQPIDLSVFEEDTEGQP